MLVRSGRYEEWVFHVKTSEKLPVKASTFTLLENFI